MAAPPSGGLVAVRTESGDIQWQAWSYADALQHFSQDLDLSTNGTVASSGSGSGGSPFLDVRRKWGSGTSYSAAFTSLTTVTDSSGNPLQLTYTPPVNCYWEVTAKVGQITANTAAYNQLYMQLNLSVADLDGVTGADDTITQHSAVQTLETHDMTRTFRLQAGVTYTVTLQLNPSGGSFQYYQGPSYIWIEAKAYAISPGASAASPVPVTVARAARVAAYTPGAGAWSKVPLDTVQFDPGTNFNLPNSRYICPVSGYYQVDGSVGQISTAANQQLTSAIYKNGVAYTAGAVYATTAAGQGVISSVSDVVYCNAGDYLELWEFPTTALPLWNVSSNSLAVVLLGAIYQVPTPLSSASWITPTFLNSWVNYGAPYATAGYLKDPFGFVHIRGGIKSGTVAAPAFILPAGYRPAGYQQYMLTTGGLNGPFPTLEGGVVIYPTGEVYVYGSNASAFTDLAGIAPFLAEN